MKGLTMLTAVINALVQQEEMVTVITCLYKINMYLNALNSQELECAQLKTVVQTKDLGYEP